MISEEEARRLLKIAESGDPQELTRQLTDIVNGFGTSGGRMDESEKLLDEALTYCRLGDLQEATFRLRLAVRPKWPSEGVCMDAYSRAKGRTT